MPYAVECFIPAGSVGCPDTVVESVRRRDRRDGRDQARALAVTQQGDRLRVAAKVGNVELDPFEGGEQVAEGVVPAGVRVDGSCTKQNVF
jgi:hypothetical protein